MARIRHDSDGTEQVESLRLPTLLIAVEGALSFMNNHRPLHPGLK